MSKDGASKSRVQALGPVRPRHEATKLLRWVEPLFGKEKRRHGVTFLY